MIEIVDAEDKIRAFLAQLDSMKDMGLVTLEKVEVVHYGSEPATKGDADRREAAVTPS